LTLSRVDFLSGRFVSTTYHSRRCRKVNTRSETSGEEMFERTAHLEKTAFMSRTLPVHDRIVK
jgi:hypothetical protein